MTRKSKCLVCGKKQLFRESANTCKDGFCQFFMYYGYYTKINGIVIGKLTQEGKNKLKEYESRV